MFFLTYHMVFSLVISYSYWQWPFTVNFPIRHGGYFHSYVGFHRAGMLSAFHFITSFWSFPSYRSIDLLQGITMILMSRIGSSTRIPKCLQFCLLTNWWLKWQWVGKHILVICLCVCAPLYEWLISKHSHNDQHFSSGSIASCIEVMRCDRSFDCLFSGHSGFTTYQ